MSTCYVEMSELYTETKSKVQKHGLPVIF